MTNLDDSLFLRWVTLELISHATMSIMDMYEHWPWLSVGPFHVPRNVNTYIVPVGQRFIIAGSIQVFHKAICERM
jgi:hypothetical protein